VSWRVECEQCASTAVLWCMASDDCAWRQVCTLRMHACVRVCVCVCVCVCARSCACRAARQEFGQAAARPKGRVCQVARLSMPCLPSACTCQECPCMCVCGVSAHGARSCNVRRRKSCSGIGKQSTKARPCQLNFATSSRRVCACECVQVAYGARVVNPSPSPSQTDRKTTKWLSTWTRRSTRGASLAVASLLGVRSCWAWMLTMASSEATAPFSWASAPHDHCHRLRMKMRL
jgi:hypothetical protein